MSFPWASTVRGCNRFPERSRLPCEFSCWRGRFVDATASLSVSGPFVSFPMARTVRGVSESDHGRISETDRRDSSARPGAESLRELQLLHLLTVPFENLSIHLGEPVVLDGRRWSTRSSTGAAAVSATSSTARSRCCSGARHQVTLLAARVARTAGSARPSTISPCASAPRHRALARRRRLRQLQPPPAAPRHPGRPARPRRQLPRRRHRRRRSRRAEGRRAEYRLEHAHASCPTSSRPAGGTRPPPRRTSPSRSSARCSPSGAGSPSTTGCSSRPWGRPA